MENKFQGLPPLKRYRLMQQELEQKHKNNGVVLSPCLPAKKRKQSLYSPPPIPHPAATTASSICLPAKKRVWALQPNLLPDKQISPFDLNIEYIPPSDEEEINEKEPDDASIEEDTPQIAENSIGGNEEGENEEAYVDEIAEISVGKNGNEEADVDEIAENSVGKNEEGENEKADVEGGGNEEAYVEEDDGIECAVCQSTDGDPSDPIVFCDGCDLMVHSTCYGSPLIKKIPDGDWFCGQCLASQSVQSGDANTLSCCLCPVTGGAMKPTNDGRWAHIVCALLVPEVFFTDPEGREGIDLSRVPSRRWEQSCYVCNGERGGVIDCSEPKCPLAFHVSCGLKEDLCIEYREGRKKGAVVAGFCKKHTELWKKQQETGKFKIVARDEHKK